MCLCEDVFFFWGGAYILHDFVHSFIYLEENSISYQKKKKKKGCLDKFLFSHLFPFRLLRNQVWCAHDGTFRFLHYHYVSVIYIEGDTDSHVEVYRFLSFVCFMKA